MLHQYKGWRLKANAIGSSGGRLRYWYKPSWFQRLTGYPKPNANVQKIYISYKTFPDDNTVKACINRLDKIAFAQGIAAIDLD